MSIKVSNLSKHYGNQKALNDMSFDIPSGQIVGFLGPNGAGKSTLMKLLTTYLTPTDGDAFVNNFNINTQTKQVQQSIGYLPEHNPLYLNQYPKEYLNFNANLYKVPKSRINEVIELTGLQNETSKKIGALSKGYRQRVGLACSLLHDPKVLLLDEPTTGLDPNQLVEIRGLIKSLGKDKTVLLSTHIMQEVEAMCDRVLVINKGTLVTDQRIDSLNTKQNLLVTFNHPPHVASLEKLPNVIGITQLKDTQFIVSFDNQENCAIHLFDFAVAHNLKLTQLQPQEINIENLFKEATN
ncbi:ATP-binding cassette domain-containing protein [Aquimarina agarilytica]|uniref:ATP-binding cassette domain-containing protein n=1 Tax=Aquimarina agarilytica TaxID=1087449 RepID=UPI00049264C2|nr:ATP-binding cassette domain-containing protein [Aquimarina agarilytica]